MFLGGVPWDITEKCLQAAFRHFGPVRIEWPGRGRAAEGGSAPKGYLYVILEGEGAVAALLAQCTHDYSGGGAWYYRWALVKRLSLTLLLQDLLPSHEVQRRAGHPLAPQRLQLREVFLAEARPEQDCLRGGPAR